MSTQIEAMKEEPAIARAVETTALEGRRNLHLKTRRMSIKRADELPIYLTLKEVAELLKVKPRTVYAWVSDGRIPYERKGGLLRFRLDAIVAWHEPAR